MALRLALVIVFAAGLGIAEVLTARSAAAQSEAELKALNQRVIELYNTGSTTTPPLIRWSIQEIRRIAIRLARKRIQPAHIIAWSFWRRAHQAAAQRAHFKKDSCNTMPEPSSTNERPCHLQSLFRTLGSFGQDSR
jgi:hypothetical protein